MAVLKNIGAFQEKMKKYGCYVLLFLVVSLSTLLMGCSEIDNEEPPVSGVVLNEEVQTENHALESLPFLAWSVDNRVDQIVLIDLVTNEVLAKFETEVWGRIFTIDNNMQGDYGVLVVYPLDEEGNLLELEITEFSVGVSGSGNNVSIDLADGSSFDVAMKFYVLDETFDVVETFEVSEPHIDFTSGAVVRDDESLHLYFAEFNHIYAYDFYTEETALAFELPEPISISRMILAAENQLIVEGHVFHADESNYIGLLDLTTGELQDWQMDFPIKDLIIQDDYLLLTEGVFIPGASPTDRVMTINLVSGDKQLIQLADNDSENIADHESQNASVIGNRFVLTGNTERIRVYDIATNDIVLERPLSMEMIMVEGELDEQGEFVEGIYPHIVTFLKVRDGLYGMVFDIGDRTNTFHVEWVSIEELE